MVSIALSILANCGMKWLKLKKISRDRKGVEEIDTPSCEVHMIGKPLERQAKEESHRLHDNWTLMEATTAMLTL